METPQPELLMFTGSKEKLKKKKKKDNMQQKGGREERVVCGNISINFMRLTKYEAW